MTPVVLPKESEKRQLESNIMAHTCNATSLGIRSRPQQPVLNKTEKEEKKKNDRRGLGKQRNGRQEEVEGGMERGRDGGRRGEREGGRE